MHFAQPLKAFSIFLSFFFVKFLKALFLKDLLLTGFIDKLHCIINMDQMFSRSFLLSHIKTERKLFCIKYNIGKKNIQTY